MYDSLAPKRNRCLGVHRKIHTSDRSRLLKSFTKHANQNRRHRKTSSGWDVPALKMAEKKIPLICEAHRYQYLYSKKELGY